MELKKSARRVVRIAVVLSTVLALMLAGGAPTISRIDRDRTDVGAAR